MLHVNVFQSFNDVLVKKQEEKEKKKSKIKQHNETDILSPSMYQDYFNLAHREFTEFNESFYNLYISDNKTQ